MRHYFARLLRRAANRLDPPRYWGNVFTPNTITGTTASTTSGTAAIRVTADWRVLGSAARLALAEQKVAQALEALADAQRALDKIRRGKESA